MASRARDWFAQAERDLEQAEASRANGRHEWACFAAQQGAEKPIEGLHLAKGQEAWGHMAARLLRELPVPVPSELIEKGRVLDNLYVGTRYPDAHPEGAPFEHYGPLQSGEAVRYARVILEFVRAQMA